MGGRLQRRWRRRPKVTCRLGLRDRELGRQRRVGGAGRNDSGVVVSSVVVGSVVVGGAGRNDSGGGDGRQRGDSGQRLRSLTRFIQPRELVLLRHEPRV